LATLSGNFKLLFARLKFDSVISTATGQWPTATVHVIFYVWWAPVCMWSYLILQLIWSFKLQTVLNPTYLTSQLWLNRYWRYSSVWYWSVSDRCDDINWLRLPLL